MELIRIKIEDFKTIKEIEIPISNLNILVGANGSGKSSILQATHLASCLLRQAGAIRDPGTSTVNVIDLDYLPSDEYWRLGHKADWGNQRNSPSSKITFYFENEDGVESTAICRARAARNAGISVSGNLPNEIRPKFRGPNTYFSGFIPGISGIPNQETKQSKRVVMKACSFGDSNVYLRNALNLLKEEDIEKIEFWLSDIMNQTVSIHIEFEEDKDLIFSAEVSLNDSRFPLELLGTGYIQLIQIFCYILLFKPKILLVDEPDIHLHPNIQEKLAPLLTDISLEMDVKILLTTHSPFIVRGAPYSTNVFWLDGGTLESDNREQTELALGWGAFGKKIIIFSEDKNLALLKKLVTQWPEIEKFVTFHPGSGYKTMLTIDQAKELHAALGEKYKLVVHRDRDSLTDVEARGLIEKYDAEGVSLWLTELSDIESYYCSPEYISNFTNCELDVARRYISEILVQHMEPLKEKFEKQRRAHNDEIYLEGGSPRSAEIWDRFQARALKGATGKKVFGHLKQKIPGRKFTELNILSAPINVELAPTLKELLESLIE